MATAPDYNKAKISEADYLEGEPLSDIKHEYIDGEVFAMAGAKMAHNRIVSNVNAFLNVHLKDSHCESASSDMKVKINTRYFYPDVLVDCSGLDDEESFTETPTLIVEVLSKSTRRMDKTIKHDAYLVIPTLQEYVIIETDVVDIEVFKRSEGWLPQHYFLGDEIHLDSIDLTLSVEEIYHRVNNEDMQEWLKKKADEAQNTGEA